MIEVPVYNQTGQEVTKFSVDENLLGGKLRPALLKQALVMYHANKRQGTVQTKGRGDVEGSTKKLYAQKHTGNARRGNIRTNVMKGGGMAFAKRPRDFRQDMPLRQRRLARNNAILSKILSNNIKLVDNLAVALPPKTKAVAGMLKALQVDRTVLIATDGLDRNFHTAARNLPKASIKPTAEINASDILNVRTLIMTPSALDGVLKTAKPGRAAAGN
ncbi:MAG: 50S ribosomal protein L4 [Phycisphaerae bacterium]